MFCLWKVFEQSVQSARSHRDARGDIPRLLFLSARVQESGRLEEAHVVQTSGQIQCPKTKEAIDHSLAQTAIYFNVFITKV